MLHDAAVAAHAMQAEGWVRRAVIIDSDVHQGNGTAAMLLGDPSLFTGWRSAGRTGDCPTPGLKEAFDVPELVYTWYDTGRAYVQPVARTAAPDVCPKGKGLMRRTMQWVAMALTLVLLAGTLIACTRPAAPTQPAEPQASLQPEQPAEPAAPVVRTTVVIHYHRYDNNYRPWDLWIWPAGAEGQGYAFTETDGYGVTATATFAQELSRAGFIVRKGGDSWAAKDVGSDRFIDIQGGRAEIWVLEGEEQFWTAAAEVPLQPRIRSAFLDSPTRITAVLSHPLDLTGPGTEGFALQAAGGGAVPIQQVTDNRQADPADKGFTYIEDGKQIRFMLRPGKHGFTDKSGKPKVYVCAPPNNWCSTATEHEFIPDPAWQMQWLADQGVYELVKAVGEGKGEVPADAEFKFTEDQGAQQAWYPGANIQLSPPGGGAGTREVVILLAEPIEATGRYMLEHTALTGAPVTLRGILDDAAFHYAGSDLGATYAPAETRFRVWAPAATAVTVTLYDTWDGPMAREIEMRRDVQGTWVAAAAGDWKNKYFTYRVTNAGVTREAVDPYARGVGTNGDRGIIVHLPETNPPNWQNDRRPPFRNFTDAVIYEMHVRDFTIAPNSGVSARGKYLGLAERGTTGPGGVKTGLDHLVELGVTHLHLLPAFDYASVDERRAGGYNWGYDPKNYNVPEGSYSSDPAGTARITEFKTMVQALHLAGIRVVMDVVYNHTYAVGDGSHFDRIVPQYYYRMDPSGTYANGSGVGNEIASERAMVRKFIVESVKYWATEYHVDGFRFDLMALTDRDTMKRVRAELDKIDPTILIYGEPWMGGSSPLAYELQMRKGAQQGMRIAVFNDNIRNAIKGDNDGTGRGFATGAPGLGTAIRRGVVGTISYSDTIADFARVPGESINYASAHDNLTLWDKITKSNSQDAGADRIRMDQLSQAIVLTSQGIPFIHGGEELLRTKQGNHNSYNAGDAINQIDWARKARYGQVFRYYQGLIALRRAHPAFRLTTAAQVKKHLTFLESPAGTEAFMLAGRAGGDAWRNIAVIYNPTREPVAVKLPGSGNWTIVADDDEAGVTPVRTGPSIAAGTVTVPPIACMVLYQR